MYNNFFTWDFNHLIFLLLPPLLRKPKMVAFLQVLISGINDIYASLKQFRKDIEYDVNFSTQKIQFEHYINDKFDRISRGITLVNAPFLVRIYLYKQVETRPIRMYKHSENQTNPRVYKLQEHEVSIHFIIQVPTGLLTDLQEKALRAYVDNRKLPNKNYTIQYI